MDLAECRLAFGPNDEGRCHWCGAPASDGPWCSPACQTAVREAHVWPAARAACRRRSAGRCVVCGTRDRVQVHHRDPVDDYRPSCAHHPDGLASLCARHHAGEHRNLRARAGTQLALTLAA